MSKKHQDLADNKLLRQKAEETLKQKQITINPILESDTEKLLHELKVHQIELEMQNQELREANETAEIALKKYTLLYDFAPMGYFTLSSEGTICDLNFTGADLLGESRFALVDSNFKLFISKESQKTFNDFFSKIYSSNAKESCEVMLGYDNNLLCRVYMEGVVTYDEKQTLLSVIDISGLSKTNP